jgi:5'-nucleotidase
MLDRILVTNDDGIDAPGLAVCEQIAAELAREVWVVAPEHDQSGVSPRRQPASPDPSQRARPAALRDYRDPR